MANRYYLYSVSKRPLSFQDRPDQINSVSEWAYLVPFTFRVLMSGKPELVASLLYENLEEYDDAELSEEFESDLELDSDLDFEPTDENEYEVGLNNKLYAISSVCEIGIQRLEKINRILKFLELPIAGELSDRLTAMLEFISEKKLNFFQLETIEVDIMSESDYQPLRECVEQEMKKCIEVGLAIDCLANEDQTAAAQFLDAINSKSDSRFNAFFGLRLDQNYDNQIEFLTEMPFGLEYAEHLYFNILNKSDAEKFNQVE